MKIKGKEKYGDRKKSTIGNWPYMPKNKTENLWDILTQGVGIDVTILM